MSNNTPHSHWRRNLYPTQSYTEDGGTTALEPEDTRPVPATIHALQDSSSSDSSSRTLIICLDGTGDKFDNDNSNVVKFVSCLKKDSASQITYYQSGIGTYDGHGLSRGYSATVDMAIGSGLGVHIKDAYRFLMQYYQEGDKICLLGFSRGSYTVRCLAGMLHKVGLLPAGNEAQISFAYQFYKDDSPEGWKLSAEFKQTFCTNVTVYFLGLWDCVDSVGIIPRTLPFSKSPANTMNYFRHAMALDEHRAKFKCCQWLQRDKESDARIRAATSNAHKHIPNSTFDRIIGARTKAQREAIEKTAAAASRMFQDNDKETKLNESRFEKEDNSEKIPPTDVLEVWFAGAHCDVGGGAVPNETRHMLSRIPLRWMIRQCFACNTGILFDTVSLMDVGLDVQSLWPVYIPAKPPVVGPSPNAMEQYETGELPPIQRRSSALKASQIERKRKIDSWGGEKQGILFPTVSLTDSEKFLLELLPEQVEDHFDALQPINDMLVRAKSWWILEFWPVKMKVLVHPDKWEKKLRMNLGSFRPVREIEPKMHWTVKLRMERAGYKLKNDTSKSATWQTIA